MTVGGGCYGCGQSVTYSCADGGVVELGNVCATDAGQRS